jgi:hypothetical protein
MVTKACAQCRHQMRAPRGEPKMSNQGLRSRQTAKDRFQGRPKASDCWGQGRAKAGAAPKAGLRGAIPGTELGADLRADFRYGLQGASRRW